MKSWKDQETGVEGMVDVEVDLGVTEGEGGEIGVGVTEEEEQKDHMVVTEVLMVHLKGLSLINNAFININMFYCLTKYYKQYE